MAENLATNLQCVQVYVTSDSGFTLGTSLLKIGSKEGPVLKCSVLIFCLLTGRDQVEDLWGIHVVQEGANTKACFGSVDLTKLLDDEGYICTCRKHLVHVGSAVCQLLELPDDFVVEKQ